jgi:hypothetical protein
VPVPVPRIMVVHHENEFNASCHAPCCSIRWLSLPASSPFTINASCSISRTPNVRPIRIMGWDHDICCTSYTIVRRSPNRRFSPMTSVRVRVITRFFFYLHHAAAPPRPRVQETHLLGPAVRVPTVFMWQTHFFSIHVGLPAHVNLESASCRRC